MKKYKKLSKSKVIIFILFLLSYGIGFFPIFFPPIGVAYIAVQIVLWCLIAKISVNKSIKCDFLCFFKIVITLLGYILSNFIHIERTENTIYLYATQLIPVSRIGILQLFLGIYNVIYVNLAFGAVMVLTFFIAKIILKKKAAKENIEWNTDDNSLC